MRAFLSRRNLPTKRGMNSGGTECQVLTCPQCRSSRPAIDRHVYDLSEFPDNDEAHIVGRIGERSQVVENRVHDLSSGEMFRSTDDVLQTIGEIGLVAAHVLLQAVCVEQQ